MPIGTPKSGQGSGPNIGPRLATRTPVPNGGQSAVNARALAVIDVAVAELQSSPAGGGIARVQVDPLPAGLVSLVDRIRVSCDSGAATTAGVYVGGTTPRHERDYTPRGNNDVADMFSPIHVGSGQALIVQWEGADDGAIATATIQYRMCTIVDVDPRTVAGLRGI